MRPIIFCDMHLATNIEEFIIKNLEYLKSRNFSAFVVESEGESVESAIASKEDLMTKLTKLNQTTLNGDYFKRYLLEEAYKDCEAGIKVIKLTQEAGIEIKPSTNNVFYEVVAIQKFVLQGKSVFAQIGYTHCKEIQEKFKDSLDYIFLYSTKDKLTLSIMFPEVPTEVIPKNFFSIETTKLSDFYSDEL